MIEIEGKFNKATVYANSLDSKSCAQLLDLCNQEFFSDAKICAMPDAHAGVGCVVGTTMTIKDKVVPNLVGVDIGCGMEVVNLGNCEIDFNKLDHVIRSSVPSGFSIRQTPHSLAESAKVENLTCASSVDIRRALNSIGTLGGGNHFIEVAREETTGDKYLVIHSGSRNVGHQVATYHQNVAAENCSDDVPVALKYLEGENFDAYINDMNIMVEYANLNRKAMVAEILKGMDWQALDSFTTIHNYLDTQNMILRKGAVSAQKGERLLIPMNMRDGSLICEGLGNQKWNFSAPHGAGRLFSRTEAKKRFTLEQFQESMAGIYTSCVSKKTIDESPAAYKPMSDILAQVDGTVKVLFRLKPVYNFKAA